LTSFHPTPPGSPSLLQVSTNSEEVHYRLHLQNAGNEVHEFTAPAFFKTAQIENPDALDPDRKQVVLQPNETKDVLLSASRPGSYDLRCADHDWAGMLGQIIVE
jgi:uncharacterized cupredoxin-like copper-binding protein